MQFSLYPRPSLCWVGVGGGITLPCSLNEVFEGTEHAGAEGDHQGEAAEASEASNTSGYFLTSAHVDPVDHVDELIRAFDGKHLFRP